MYIQQIQTFRSIFFTVVRSVEKELSRLRKTKSIRSFQERESGPLIRTFSIELSPDAGIDLYILGDSSLKDNKMLWISARTSSLIVADPVNIDIQSVINFIHHIIDTYKSRLPIERRVVEHLTEFVPSFQNDFLISFKVGHGKADFALKCFSKDGIFPITLDIRDDKGWVLENRNRKWPRPSLLTSVSELEHFPHHFNQKLRNIRNNIYKELFRGIAMTSKQMHVI